MSWPPRLGLGPSAAGPPWQSVLNPASLTTLELRQGRSHVWFLPSCMLSRLSHAWHMDTCACLEILIGKLGFPQSPRGQNLKWQSALSAPLGTRVITKLDF